MSELSAQALEAALFAASRLSFLPGQLTEAEKAKIKVALTTEEHDAEVRRQTAKDIADQVDNRLWTLRDRVMPMTDKYHDYYQYYQGMVAGIDLAREYLREATDG